MEETMRSSTKRREGRLEVRLTPRAKAMLKQAANQQAHSAQTYVLAKDLRVLGYYSLAAEAVTHDEATERKKKGMARHPIPVILLARLAVDVSIHGKGVGSALLKDVLMRTGPKRCSFMQRTRAPKPFTSTSRLRRVRAIHITCC